MWLGGVVYSVVSGSFHTDGVVKEMSSETKKELGGKTAKHSP